MSNYGQANRLEREVAEMRAAREAAEQELETTKEVRVMLRLLLWGWGGVNRGKGGHRWWTLFHGTHTIRSLARTHARTHPA